MARIDSGKWNTDGGARIGTRWAAGAYMASAPSVWLRHLVAQVAGDYGKQAERHSRASAAERIASLSTA
jgi:hypothetical protein